MLVNATPFSLPMNTANLPTESVETQNKFAERIPKSDGAYESSGNKGLGTEQRLNDSENTQSQEVEEKPTEQETKQTQAESSEDRKEASQQAADDQLIRKLQATDRRVRAHEQAHSSAGGAIAGAPSYSYQSGPNGVRYAVGGEVPIDVSGVPGNPQATLSKAQQVIRAALAPADPSSTDRQVASYAQALASKARYEISRLSAEKIQSGRDEIKAKISGEEEVEELAIPGQETSLAGSHLKSALKTDATEQVGGQVSSSV